MTIYKFTPLTLPPTLEKQRDVLEAYRTLVDQDDEAIRQRRAEIAALRRDLEDLRRFIDAFRRRATEQVRTEILKELKARKYSPDQPRVPAGNPHGGEWTSEASGESPNGSRAIAVAPALRAPQRGPQYAQAHTGTDGDDVVLVGEVTPQGFSIDQVPAPDPPRSATLE